MQPMLARRLLTSLSSSSTAHDSKSQTAPIPIPARKPDAQPITRIEELFHHNPKPKPQGVANGAPRKPAPRAESTDLKSLPAPPTLNALHVRSHTSHRICPFKKHPLRTTEEYRLVVLGGAAQWIIYTANPARGPEAREMLAEAAGKHDEAFRAFKEEIERTRGWVEISEEMKGDGLREKTEEEQEIAERGLEEEDGEELAREAVIECECRAEEAEARVRCGRKCLL